ncbi:uncharacterized protein LACBIDRAFT_330932 [Laccaria bicolor S238N-H82]|uniref:Predicted protein n=1 Tax=Laccaria bicolor (strain S238N-H82 / ATCC MYA-4686) TaxID=486041 RepID=B0DMQ4_LACBS|nr:uncharacterized protein LACBIDRAFT_330932 [Laccaria bicolor S238N-H82]EDR04096.1 predicted protein [Laccaria bicolor S238N-H82]|eukprot:XP_001885351.1 predicted protein [Laccaria bicolor S238N-H82]
MSTLPGHDHISSSAPDPSLDGKGGTESAAKAGEGPSYVYYRLYTKLGAFESNHALYDNDRFIGRIPSKSIAPPRTVASIKRSLCKLEDLLVPDKVLLFTPLSSPAPKEDSARLSLSALSGPGLSEQDPIALVVESEKRTDSEVSQSEKLPEQGKGDEKAKTFFNENDVSLGRINTLFVALESMYRKSHARYKDMELFQDVDSDTAMSDADVISFQGDTYPGSDEGAEPVALVNATPNTASDHKAKPTSGKVLSKYPIDTAATVPALSDGPDSNFTNRARIRYDHSYNYLNWLSLNKNEIVYTDGVKVTHRYMVINSKGEKGFVNQECIAFGMGYVRTYIGSEGVEVLVP